MAKNINILSSLLLVSALTLTPSVATATITTNQATKQNSLSSSIAKILYRRGIEKKSAIKIANAFFNVDEELFSIMLQNLQTNYSSISQEQFLDFLANQALMRKDADLTSYSYLVNMLYQITKKPLQESELATLNLVSVKNQLLAA